MSEIPMETSKKLMETGGKLMGNHWKLGEKQTPLPVIDSHSPRGRRCVCSGLVRYREYGPFFLADQKNKKKSVGG